MVKEAGAYATVKLPVLQILFTAYGAVAGHVARFFLAAIPALTMIMAFWILRLAWDSQPAWFILVWLFVDILPYIFFGLVWFGLYEAPESWSPLPVFNERSLAYFAFAILAYLLIWVPIYFVAGPVLVEVLETMRMGARLTFVTQIQGFVLLPAMIVTWLYLLSRVSQVLPAAALGESLGPYAAWRATAGNGLRLLTAYVLAGLPALVLVTALASLALWRGHWENHGSTYSQLYAFEQATVGTVLAVLRLAMVALLVTVAAEAYRHFVGRRPPPTKTTVVAFD